MSEIIKAVAEVMGKVGSVEKKGRNDFHRYAYATAADIQHALQPHLAAAGLVIFQNEVEREFLANGEAVAVKYEFTLAHVSGEKWGDKPIHTGVAAARNTKGGFDDKCINKTYTAARKYFLLALFQIPTGDYDDADADEDKPKASKPAVAKPTTAAPKENTPFDDAGTSDAVSIEEDMRAAVLLAKDLAHLEAIRTDPEFKAGYRALSEDAQSRIQTELRHKRDELRQEADAREAA